MTRVGKQDAVNKNGKVVFNHVVKFKTREKVDEFYTALKQYCSENNMVCPDKGMFVSEVVDSSPVLRMSFEQYMKGK